MDFSESHGILLGVALLATGCAAPVASARGGATPLALAQPDGTTVALEMLWHGYDATVLVFWSGTCPCARRYQGRIDALLNTYPPERVRIIAVSSNAGEAYGDALKVASQRGMRVPVYRDENGRVARALGARSTPTAVVLDARGDVRYVGWIDNERLPGEDGREPWLDRAITGILAGNRAFAARSPVYGCPITRALFVKEPEPAEATRLCCTGKQ